MRSSSEDPYSTHENDDTRRDSGRSASMGVAKLSPCWPVTSRWGPHSESQ